MQGSERASAEPAMAIAEGHAHMSEVMARILHSEMKPKAEEQDGPSRPRNTKRRRRREEESEEGSLGGVEEGEGEGGRGEEGEGEGQEGERQISGERKMDTVRECHVLPDAYALERERKLQRIATRGVVQLFNAVSKHQKEVEEKLKEVKTSERKKAKVLSSVDKGSFIDMLKGGRNNKMTPTSSLEEVRPGGGTQGIIKGDNAKQRISNKKTGDIKEKVDELEDDEPSSKWTILRDDYMLGAKLKDWDKPSHQLPRQHTNDHGDSYSDSNQSDDNNTDTSGT